MGNDSKQLSLFEKQNGARADRVPWNSLDDLRSETVSCTRCALRCQCTQVVFGEGNPHADVMLVGEGPGRQEDELGRPFVGRAGQLLDKILEAASLGRDRVYIGNVVKCRPPGNRAPSAEEIELCIPWLIAQIRLIRPAVLVCLGAVAARALIDPELRITNIRGSWREVDGLLIMPTYHPAALLRDPGKKRPVWEDFKKIRDVVRELKQSDAKPRTCQ